MAIILKYNLINPAIDKKVKNSYKSNKRGAENNKVQYYPFCAFLFGKVVLKGFFKKLFGFLSVVAIAAQRTGAFVFT